MQGGYFYGKFSGVSWYPGPYRGRYIHRGRRTCPHRKIYIYPQIHGTCCIATDVRYKAGRDQRSASFKRIRQNHHHSRNKIYSQRSSSHHSRRRSAGKDPPDRQCGFSGKGCIRADGGRERTNGKNSLVWAGNPISRGRTHRNTESNSGAFHNRYCGHNWRKFRWTSQRQFSGGRREDYSGTEKTAETIYRAGKFADAI